MHQTKNTVYEKTKNRGYGPCPTGKILLTCYAKIGISVSPGEERLKNTCGQILKYQRALWIDTIDLMFEMYANGKLACPGVNVEVSSWFFAKLKEAYFEQAAINKRREKHDKEKAFRNNPGKVAFTRFMKYCETYKKFPVKEQWLLIFKFLVERGDFIVYKEFDNEPLEIQIKTARFHIKKHAKDFFAKRAMQSPANSKNEIISYLRHPNQQLAMS